MNELLSGTSKEIEIEPENIEGYKTQIEKKIRDLECPLQKESFCMTCVCYKDMIFRKDTESDKVIFVNALCENPQLNINL